MIVRNFITQDIPSLKLTDTVQYALIMMEDFVIQNLPVVEDGKLIGYCTYNTLSGLDPDAKLQALDFNVKPVSIDPSHSVINGLKLLSNTRFDVLAVAIEDEYLGMIWSKDLIAGLGQSTTAQNDGSVLLLRCNLVDYSISEIGRLVESEGGKILGLWTWQPTSTHEIDVLIKLNIRHIDHATHILQSNGYTILHQINQQSSDLFEDRYKSLMKYLDI